MAERIPARLTPAEGRRFGLTVGAAFLLLAAVSRWRGHLTTPWVLGGAGALLVGAALVLPGRLTAVHRAWMRLGLAISSVTTPIFMGLIYFAVLTPMGLLLRLLGRNPLRHREVDHSFWRVRSADRETAESLRRQF